MQEYKLDYYTWRRQPWRSVIENFKVLEAKRRFQEEQERKAKLEQARKTRRRQRR